MRIHQSKFIAGHAAIAWTALLLANPVFGGPKFHAPASMPTELTSGEGGSTLQPTGKELNPVQQAARDFMIIDQRVQYLLRPEVLADPIKRADAAPRAIPLLYYQTGLSSVIGTLKTQPAFITQAFQRDILTKLCLLNDPMSLEKLKQLRESTDPSNQLEAKVVDLHSRWMVAGNDPAESKKLADELNTLARAHSDDTEVARLVHLFQMDDRSPEIDAQMLDLSENVMRDPNTLGVRAMIAAHSKKYDDGKAQQDAMVNKPIVIAGKTADGKDFTTADWKGKVVLVDFWATWCGPCVAGLPHVKDLYAKYHGQGLEVIGVSSDTSLDTMKKFVAKHDMAWPDLFDTTLDSAHSYSDVTRANHVYGIPTAFVIDKKGILRGVTVGPMTMDDLIARLVAEDAVAPEVTPAIQPTTQPTTRPMTKGGPLAQYRILQSEYYKILPIKDHSDPVKRQQAAPQLIPILQKKIALLATPNGGITSSSLTRADLALLYLLNDPATVDKVNKLLASPDPSDKIEGQLIQIYSRWYGGGTDHDLLSKACDDMTVMDKAHSDDFRCTLVTAALMTWAHAQNKPDLAAKMQDDMDNVMTDPSSLKRRAMLAKNKQTHDAGDTKEATLLNQPLVIEGKSLDGKQISTADFTGKVVLVDFWATWCGPCVKELPHVEEVYKKYHAQGLEVMGVSKDFSAQAPLKFLAKNDMPWPQILDASTPNDGNAATPSNKCGVTTIPFVLLIDKKGIVRSVTAKTDMDTMIPKLLAE